MSSQDGGPYKQIYSVDPESVRKMFFSSGMKEELYEMRRYISSTVADLRRLGHLLNSREYISVVDFERWFQSSREESRRYILDFMKGNRVNVVAQSNDTLLSYPALTVVYEAPPACVNKLNTDGAFIASGIPGVPGKAAWSGVWRDCENNLGPVYSGKVDGIFSSYEAEMCGICYSARASYENSGLRNEPWVWENDNLDLVNAINSGIHKTDHDFVVKHSDIESILSAFPYCLPPQYVPREGNRLADFIAGEAQDGRPLDLSEVLRRAIDDPFLWNYRLKYLHRDWIN